MKVNLILALLMFLSMRVSAQSENDILDLIQSQRYKEAAALIRQSPEISENNFKAMKRLAWCYLMGGNLPEAEKCYLELYKKDSTDLSIYYSLAALYERRGNYQKASEYYLALVVRDSTSFTAFKKLANIAEVSRDNDRALEYFKRANSLDPQEPDVAYDYAMALKAKENFQKADSIIQNALSADTLNLQLIKGRFDLAYRLKAYKEARIYAEKALQMGDSDAQTINILALSYYNLNQYQYCIDTYKTLEGNKLANETTFYYTALSYRKLNKPDSAIVYLNRSIDESISDNISAYYRELAKDYESLRAYQKCVASILKSDEFEPRNVHNYSLARLYDAFLKNPAKARKYYQAYVNHYKDEKEEKDLYRFSIERLKNLKR